MKRLIKYGPIALAAVLTVGVMTLFKACGPMDDGSWMSCHYAQLQVFAIAVVMLVVTVANIFLNNQKLKLCLDIASVILALVAIFIPSIITHLCMMDTMRCHTLMRPFVVLISALFIIIKLISIIYERVLKKEQ